MQPGHDDKAWNFGATNPDSGISHRLENGVWNLDAHQPA
jgi:hypothetical protein